MVEDDPSSRRALLLLLKLKGFQAIPASSLSEAMRQLDNHPATVLLDLMLPDGNGASVLQYIRTHHLPIRVAVTSGASNWRSMLGDETIQPDAVFCKPLNLNDLLRWLDEPHGEEGSEC